MAVLGRINIVIGSDATKLYGELKKTKNFVKAELSNVQQIASKFGSKLNGVFQKALSGSKILASGIDGAGIKIGNISKGFSNLLGNVSTANTGFSNFNRIASKGLGILGDTMNELNFSMTDLLNPLGLAQLGLGLIGKSGVFSFENIIKYITKALNLFIDFYNSSLSLRLSIEGIKFAFLAIWETAKLVFNNIKQGFSTVGKVVKAVLKGEFSSIGEIVSSGFVAVKTNIGNTASNIGNLAGDGIKSALTNRLNYIEESDVKGFLDNFISFGQKAGESFSQGIKKALVELPSLIPSIPIPTSIASQNQTEAPTISNRALEVYNQVLEKIKLVTQQQKIFGDEIDLTSEKTNIWKTAINQLLEEGLNATNPAIQLFKEKLDSVRESANVLSIDMNDVLQQALSGFGDSIANALLTANSFGDGLAKAFDGVFATLASVMEQLGKTAIQAGLGIEAIKKSFVTFGGLGSIALGGALILFARQIKNSVSNIPPKLAKGGLAFGETLAVVGDNPNASVNPEVIAPLDKLKSMIGGTGNVFIPDMVLRGEDIYISFKRTEEKRSYFGQN